MVCLARLIRWAMVASGTRKAWAISAVFRPPTARRVSAMADGGVSAGWQHMNSRMSVSSPSSAQPPASSGPRSCSLARLRRHLVLAPAARLLAAHLIGHAPERRPGSARPRGLSGQALARPLQRRRQQRLLDRVLGGGEVPEPAHERAQDLRRQLAQQVLDPRGRRPRPSRVRSTTAGATPTGRTSTGMFSGTPPRPGAAEMQAAISMTRSGLLHVDQPVAGQELLGLGKRAVGHHRRPPPVRGAHHLGLVGPGSAPGRRPARRGPSGPR